MIRRWFALVVVAALAVVLGAGQSAAAYDYDLVSSDGAAVSQSDLLVAVGSFERAGAVDSSAGSVVGTRLRPVDDFVAPQTPPGGKRNHLRPDDDAVGSHSTFRTDADGNVTHYSTWDPNPYPQYPKPWVQQKRVDVIGDPHVNKVTGESVPTPHVQGRDIPGGVRAPTPDELPEWAR